MKFCPDCGSLLKPRKGKLICDCGYSTEEKINVREKIEHKEIEIVDENESYGRTTIPLVCWNCKKRGVYFWMRQMARADEAPTKFFRCKHCGKTWRSSK